MVVVNQANRLGDIYHCYDDQNDDDDDDDDDG